MQPPRIACPCLLRVVLICQDHALLPALVPQGPNGPQPLTDASRAYGWQVGWGRGAGGRGAKLPHATAVRHTTSKQPQMAGTSASVPCCPTGTAPHLPGMQLAP